MSQAASQNVEATRLDGYLVFLFFLLSTATLFDGFDNAMQSFAAPDVRATLRPALQKCFVALVNPGRHATDAEP